MEYVQLVLITYYVVAALNRTDGPGGAFYKLRQNHSLPLYCSICLAPWAALVAFLAVFWLPEPISIVLAIAGAVVALEDFMGRIGELL